MNKLEVMICGEPITLKSRESKEYIFELANYVNEKLENLVAKSTSAAVDDRIRAILIALNIADDYFKAKILSEELQSKQRIQDVEKMELLDEIDALRKECNNLSEEVGSLKDIINKHEEKIKIYEIEIEENETSILSMPSNLRKNIAR